jgi:hypothetical protein
MNEQMIREKFHNYYMEFDPTPDSITDFFLSILKEALSKQAEEIRSEMREVMERHE